jgi:hypothetical protein
MATADWKNINLVLEKDTPISIKLEGGIIKVNFGKYEAKFDFEPLCCEDYGFKIPELNIAYSYGSENFERENIFIADSCKLEYNIVHEGEDSENDNSFILAFNNYRIIFYNNHNGYYAHSFSIYKNEDKIFVNYL